MNLKQFRVIQKNRKQPVIHEPRWLYDCDRCKFNWCCGELCACALNLGSPHKYKLNKERQKIINSLQEEWRKENGY